MKEQVVILATDFRNHTNKPKYCGILVYKCYYIYHTSVRMFTVEFILVSLIVSMYNKHIPLAHEMQF